MARRRPNASRQIRRDFKDLLGNTARQPGETRFTRRITVAMNDELADALIEAKREVLRLGLDLSRTDLIRLALTQLPEAVKSLTEAVAGPPETPG